MAKFAVFDNQVGSTMWGDFFTDDKDKLNNPDDNFWRSLVASGKMPLDEARTTIDELDLEKPWKFVYEFIRAVAAISALYPTDMAVKTSARSRTVRHLLSTMCSHKKVQYLFNNLRARYSLPISMQRMQAVGTTAVEAINKQINALIRYMGTYYIETLLLKLTMYHWLHSKAHNGAMYRSTVRRREFDEVSATIAGCFSITDEQWHRFCSCPPSSALSEQRARTAAALHDRGETILKVREKFKRTPFTLLR